MLAHDLAHVSLGVGFTIAEEATVRCAKLNYRYIARIDRATAAILKGENVVLR